MISYTLDPFYSCISQAVENLTYKGLYLEIVAIAEKRNGETYC